MRADLLDAQASVDWPESQLPSLESRIVSWLQFNLEVVIKDPDPDCPNNVIVVAEKEPFSRALNVEIGAYINTIRSSLDILASALWARNRVSNNPEAHFPIFACVHDFIDPLIGLESKKWKWLSAAERSIIKRLKPYPGGNDLLWSLHQLDIMRKHRRLLKIEPTPAFFRVAGPSVYPIANGWIRARNETVIALIAKNAPQPQITRTFTITFDEPGMAERKPLIAALYDLAGIAKSIIESFDTA
jgi:hypothetical protein